MACLESPETIGQIVQFPDLSGARRAARAPNHPTLPFPPSMPQGLYGMSAQPLTAADRLTTDATPRKQTHCEKSPP